MAEEDNLSRFEIWQAGFEELLEHSCPESANSLVARDWHLRLVYDLTTNEQAASEAKRYASERYLEIMQKMAPGPNLSPEDFTRINSEVRGKIGSAFMALQHFKYTPNWKFDVKSEDLLMRFLDVKWSRVIADEAAAEARGRLITGPRKTCKSPRPLDLGPTGVTMYFSPEALRLTFQVNWRTESCKFPMTIDLTLAPDGAPVVAPEAEVNSRRSRAITYNVWDILKHQVDGSPLGEEKMRVHVQGTGLHVEVVLAAFIRKCMSSPQRTSAADLYATKAAVVVPSSVSSLERHRLKTALDLAGFADSVLVQPSTALAMTIAKDKSLTSGPHSILTVFADKDVVEMSTVLVENANFTTLDVHVLAYDRLEAMLDEALAEALVGTPYCVFARTKEAEGDVHKRGVAKIFSKLTPHARVTFRPLSASLLPGPLSISNGMLPYRERFPWEVIVRNPHVVLAQQNMLIPDKLPELQFKIEDLGDAVQVFRRVWLNRRGPQGDAGPVETIEAFLKSEELPARAESWFNATFMNVIRVTKDGLVKIATPNPVNPREEVEVSSEHLCGGDLLSQARRDVDNLIESSVAGRRRRLN